MLVNMAKLIIKDQAFELQFLELSDIFLFLFVCFVQIGAGFYLNATQEKWKNWRMYDYVVKELPKLLSENFPLLDTSKSSISGHSMGGHGALTIYLKNLDKYKVVDSDIFVP